MFGIAEYILVFSVYVTDLINLYCAGESDNKE